MNSLVFKIVYNSTTAELIHAPDGWDDGLLNLSRQKLSNALFRNFTVKLGFVKDGANLLRSIFYNDKIDAEAYLQIWKLNRISLEDELKYTGAFDFSTFEDGEYKVDITVVDNSMSAFIKTNGKTKFLLNDFIGLEKTLEYDIDLDTYTSSIISFSNVFEKLLDKVTLGRVTDGVYDIDTSAIDNLPYYMINGGSINGTGLYIKTSLNDFLQTLFALSGLSLDLTVVGGVETASFVDMGGIYDNTGTPYHISNISDFKLTVDTDKLFSKLTVGYDDVDDPNYAEVNSESVFNVDIKNSSTDIELKSAYRGDWNGITTIAVKEEIDSSDNDEMFVVSVFENTITGNYNMEDGVLKIKNIIGYEDEGLLYNSRITPKRIMITHADYLSSCLDMAGYQIEFASGQFFLFNFIQTKLRESPWPPYTDEREGITLSAPVFFKPYLFEFEANVDDDFYDEMVADTAQYISFDYRGNTFTGFLIDTKIKLHGKSKAKIKLICSADNDLTNLINNEYNPVDGIEYSSDFSDASNANYIPLIT